MEIEIKSTNDNKLLGRKEIEAKVSFDGPTPKRNEVLEAVSKKVGMNPDFAVLRQIVNEYGIQRVAVVVHAYENKERMEKIEPEHLRSRGMTKEAREAASPKKEKKTKKNKK